MKIAELRKLDSKELQEKLVSLMQERLSLSIKQTVQRTNEVNRQRIIRFTIARIHTLLTEKLNNV